MDRSRTCVSGANRATLVTRRGCSASRRQLSWHRSDPPFFTVLGTGRSRLSPCYFCSEWLRWRCGRFIQLSEAAQTLFTLLLSTTIYRLVVAVARNSNREQLGDDDYGDEFTRASKLCNLATMLHSKTLRCSLVNQYRVF